MLPLVVGVTVVALLAGGVSELWSMHTGRHSAATWAIVVCALLAATQLVFRAYLRRRLAIDDLI